MQGNDRIARSEVERRAKLFEELEAAPDNVPQLKDLVVQCLDNDLYRRPRSGDIMNQLESIRRNNRMDPFGSAIVERAAAILRKFEENRIVTVSSELHLKLP